MSQSARDVIAANITALIGGMSRRAWALEHGLDLKLVERLQKGTNAPTLDNLEVVAKKVKVPLWQLLAPNLGQGVTVNQPTAPAWPFEDVSQDELARLSVKQLAKVDMRLKDAVREVSGEFSTKNGTHDR